MKPIRIIDSSFNLVGELDNYTSYELSRKWGLGAIALSLIPEETPEA